MEATINKVELNGYLGKNPEIRTLKNGKVMVSMSVATNDSHKNFSGEWVENTVWHNVIMWKDLDENIKDQVKKGSRVAITGKLNTRKYLDNNGQNRYITEIIASTIEPVIQ